MTEDIVVDIARDMLWCIIKSAAPMLIVSLLVGLIISIFQTVTSIQEQTLTFVPKLIGIFIVLILAGGWIINNVVEFFQSLCAMFPELIG
ncbi:MAG: flagellar biosynthesis protein FliQ [Lachnospiraceae bacterium]|nr:flagellar biosynthesis protein FliQ [Lachnospiraceae bacterium]